MKYQISLFALVFVGLLIYGSAYAQSDSAKQEKGNDISMQMAVKLQQKILLTDNQTLKVKKELEEYYKSPNHAAEKNADKKIQSFLDSRQKAKYEIIKDDWWKFVKESRKKK